MDFEITIIGGGVVGLAIASKLGQTSRHLLLLEKNEKYGLETSSRNSEVIHAGIYYPPGSLKAKLCVEGKEELYTICSRNEIPHRRISKLISATSPEELAALEQLYDNGLQNGVELELLDGMSAKKLEPNIVSFGAVYSPSTGVLSVHDLMDYFYRTALEKGCTVQHRSEVVGIEPVQGGYRLRIREGSSITEITSEKVINSAGLGSDTIAGMLGIDIDAAGYRLHYAKGSYFSVTPAKWKVISRLVYPLPGHEGLGVHAVVDVGGRLRFGPDVEYLPDRTLNYAVDEGKRTQFAEGIQRLIPSITADDLVPDMAGIRAKLQKGGEPPRDFVIVHEREKGFEGFVNLIGIDSPGLTCSPAIARYVENLLD